MFFLVLVGFRVKQIGSEGLPGIVADSLNKRLESTPYVRTAAQKCIINENSLTDAWD